MTHIALDRLHELLERARAVRVTVVGDAMLDVYLAGDAERISPEAPVPVVRIRERRQALGGAANVAQNVRAIGARCNLVAAVGQDDAGAALRGMLLEIGASDAGLATVARCTTSKTRILARSQQMLRFDEEEDDDLLDRDVEEILRLADEAINNADVVVLEDYNKGVLTPGVIRHVIDRARDSRLPVIVDPKYRNFFAYRGATIFKPNRRELQEALGATMNIEHTDALPTAVTRFGVEQILLTLGERGMVLYSETGELASIPTVAREVFDVVGAGDTVTAYLAAMLAAGGSSVEAAVIANIAAGIEVSMLGAVSVAPDELLAYAEEHGLHL